MDQPSTSPQPPALPDAPYPATKSTSRFWSTFRIWVVLAAFISMAGTPADPTSMLFGLAYGLASFAVGAAAGSRLPVVLRALPLVLWLAGVITLVLYTDTLYLILFEAGYALAGIAVGFWAGRSAEPRGARTRAASSAG